MCVHLVQPVEVAGNEASNHVVTTSSPILQNTLLQPITGMDDINSIIACPQDTLAYDITTVPCQPAEDKDTLFISTNHSSLPNKADETIVMIEPFCEGLSGCVDDYSYYSTDQFEVEEGIQYIVPIYCKPQIPQFHWFEDCPLVVQDCPLVVQDEHSPTITILVPSSTTGSGKIIRI